MKKKKSAINIVNPNDLIDGKYSISDLLDINQLEELFKQFNKATGFTIGFLDHPNLNILIAIGWRDICTKFHRVAPKSLKNCLRSNHRLLDKLRKPGQVVIEGCANGMVDCATPVIIEGKHVASLATGQMFLGKPDILRFKKQAKIFGFNERDYLKALEEVPVVDAETLKNVTRFLGSMAVVLSQAGYTRLVHEREIEKIKKTQDELKENTQKYQQLFESANDAIWMLEGDMFIDCNQRAISLFGCKDKIDLVDHTPGDFSPVKQPDGQSSREKSLKYIKLAFEGHPQRFYWKHQKKDGTLVDTEISLNVLNIGEKKYLQAIGRDITEIKKAEDELKKAKENVEKQVEERTVELNKQKTFLSSILENVPNMIFVKDAKDLKFELFNKAGEELLGYKREQLIGKSDYDFFPKEQAEFFIEKDRGVVKSGKLLDIPEEPINTKSGKRFLHTKKIPIYDDHKAKYLMGISEDITERKKRETEYSALLENMLDGLVVLDTKGNFLEVNDSYCKMLKYLKKDLLNLNLNFIDVKNDSKKMNDYLQEIIAMGSGKFETRHKRKDGSVIDVEMSVTYLESSNKLFAFIHDINERKKYEKELVARAEELERFNRAAIGRELKMVELKKKIAKLSGGGK